nr:hypothetical protein [Deltaproteobacteria bacterium]
LAEDPAARPSSHELAERVQDYLDGDRDHERRRQLAAQQLAAARDALATGDADARATAMRRAGRALALDPESVDAAELVSALVLEPPPAIPPGLAASLAAYDSDQTKQRARRALYAYCVIVALFPVLLLLEVKNWTFVIAFYGAITTGMLVTAQAISQGRSRLAPVLVVNLAIVVLFTRFGGPFLLTPVLICCMLTSITAIPALHHRTWLVLAWIVAAVMLPIILEWVDVLPRSWAMTDGATVVRSTVFHSRGDAAAVFSLTFTSLAFTVVAGLVALGMSRSRSRAERQIFMQAWHLRHLIPETAAPTPVARVR